MWGRKRGDPGRDSGDDLARKGKLGRLVKDAWSARNGRHTLVTHTQPSWTPDIHNIARDIGISIEPLVEHESSHDILIKAEYRPTRVFINSLSRGGNSVYQKLTAESW
jgi:hypothetical protein